MRLVFLHAAGSSGDEWVQQRLGFAHRFDVRTPDLPGHGASGAPALETVDAMAEWIAAEVGDVSGDAVVGHSLGAAVALAVAAARRPRGLVLVGAARRSRLPDGFVDQVARDASVAVERLATRGFAPAAGARLVERASGYLARTDPAVLARDFAAAARFDATPYLRRVTAPTLVVVGAEDRLTSVADAEDVARAIAGARLEIVDGAGHMVMLERPREFNGILGSFVEALP